MAENRQREPEPDTFETPDPPQVLPNLRIIDEPANDDIDSTPVDTKGIFAQFSDKKLDTSKQDYSLFSIKSHDLPQTEYGVNRLARNSESPLERFNRLQAELLALSNDLDVIQKEDPNLEVDQGNKASDIALHVQGLKSVLDKCELTLAKIGQTKLGGSSDLSEKILQEIQAYNARAGSQDRLTYELYATPDSNKSNQISHISELDSRLVTIEKQLGNNADLQTPILPTLDNLEEKLAVLDPTHLESIETKLANLVERFSQNKALINSDNFPQEKVDQLFELVSKWDSTSQQVPVIVDRLVTLRQVHEQSAQAVSAIAQIQQEQAETSALIKTAASNFDLLQQAFKENLSIIESNTQRLEQKMADLSQKISALS